MIHLYDTPLQINDLKCWQYSSEFNIYIFTKVFENETKLIEEWESINETIAVEFQSVLDDEVAIWNLYVIFFVKGMVSIEAKYKIEEDTYATRKMVKDNFIVNNEQEFIEKKLFKIDIEHQSQPSTKFLKDELKDYKDLNKLLEDTDNEN